MITRRTNLQYGVGAAAALSAGWAAPALAQTTIAGVKFEAEASVAGQRLQLNGAGVRFRAIFKVYAAALYTPAKITTNEAAIRVAGPRRLHLVALRTVGGDDFGNFSLVFFGKKRDLDGDLIVAAALHVRRNEVFVERNDADGTVARIRPAAREAVGIADIVERVEPLFAPPGGAVFAGPADTAAGRDRFLFGFVVVGIAPAHSFEF